LGLLFEYFVSIRMWPRVSRVLVSKKVSATFPY
jgi:hypothetical protein